MKELTIKDLLLKNSTYYATMSVNKEYWLFIKGLSDNGEGITSDFDISLVKNVIVEIMYNSEVIDTLEASLSTKILHLVKEAETIINNF